MKIGLIGAGSRGSYTSSTIAKDPRVRVTAICDVVEEQITKTRAKIGNADAMNVVLGKAGRKRWMGRRPHVRGTAMNPIDHPHGGGEGKSGQGNPHPVSPWGWQTKGKKTRSNKRTDSAIVQRRKK